MQNELNFITMYSSNTPRSKTVLPFSDAKYGNLALWGGIVFSFLFTGLIWLTGDRLVMFAKPEDQGPFWYYWILQSPTWFTRTLAWGSYAAHQLAIWGLIYYAQTQVKTYTKGLHRVNMLALAVNAGFIGWHWLHTHLFYDKLAQDTSIFSSQGSVILMLVWIILMENNRRGIFFGKRLPFGKSIIEFAKKYHGYVFSWATIYTFWYHPGENTQGHLIGFLYMFLLMLQGSLFLTRIHVNRWWMVTQEVTVLIHGALVAAQQVQGTLTEVTWPMFAFGFGLIFVVTQLHGLGLKNWQKWLVYAVFAALIAIIYGQRGWGKIDEIIRVPAIEYICAIVLGLLIGLGIWIRRGILAVKTRFA